MVINIFLLNSLHLHFCTLSELIGGRLGFLFTWLIIIRLVNTVWGVPITPIIIVGNVIFQFKFLFVESPPNPLSNFVAYPISTPLLTTYMLGATIVSTLVVVIPTSNDWITFTPTCFLQVSTIATSNTISGVVLIQDRRSSSLLLPIGILYGAQCGCKCTFGFLLLI